MQIDDVYIQSNDPIKNPLQIIKIYYLMRLRNSRPMEKILQLHSHHVLESIIKTASSIHSHPTQAKKCSQHEYFTSKVLKHLTDNTHRVNRLNQFFTVSPEHKMKNKIARHIPAISKINIILYIVMTKINVCIPNLLPAYAHWNTIQI